MPADFSGLKVAELRDKLTAAGADTTGKKADLVARLEALAAASPTQSGHTATVVDLTGDSPVATAAPAQGSPAMASVSG